MNESQNENPSPVCLVTGGTSGIGLATAKLFAQNGYRVAICGRNEERLAEAKKKISLVSENVLLIQADLCDVETAKSMIQTVIGEFQRLDVLVNNAAIAPLQPLETISESQFENLTNINIRSVFYLTQSAWNQMLVQKSGAIVNISSMAAVDPFPEFSLYGASKAWIELWTKALGTEGESKGIRTYCVRPGAVETPMLRGLFPDFPADQCVSPEEIAAKVWSCVDQVNAHQTGTTYQVAK